MHGLEIRVHGSVGSGEGGNEMPAKTWLDEQLERLLDQVRNCYPEARIAASKKRLKALWDGKPYDGRIPYVLWGLPPGEVPELPEGLTDNERELVVQLASIIAHSVWEDDYVPGLVPGVRQVIIPSYFGSEEEFASASLRVKPIIRKPMDVYELPEVGFGPGTPGGEMLERMRYFREKTRGQLPIYEADLQGPFSVASQIWGVEAFLLAVLDYPTEVHYLLQRTTDAIITYARLMREAAEGDWIPFHCMPAVWFPEEKGIAVSEDLMAVVSPKIFREFMRPYLEQLADAFGGVFVHSCGSINHVIKELNELRGLVGVNFSSVETDLRSLAKEARESMVLVVHQSPVNRTDLPLLTPLEHARLCGEVFCSRGGGLCMLVPCTGELIPDVHAEAVEKALTCR